MNGIELTSEEVKSIVLNLIKIENLADNVHIKVAIENIMNILIK